MASIIIMAASISISVIICGGNNQSSANGQWHQWRINGINNGNNQQ
jgi:hypothetical protein